MIFSYAVIVNQTHVTSVEPLFSGTLIRCIDWATIATALLTLGIPPVRLTTYPKINPQKRETW